MGPWTIRRVPRYLRHWRVVDAGHGGDRRAPMRDAILLLSARQIPWRLHRWAASYQVFVPALYETIARQELTQYRRENTPSPPPAPPPLYGHWGWAPLYLLPLIWLHPLLSQPWQQAAALDGVAVLLRGEWWRIGTALTIHADWGHVVANVAFGSLFICILARLCGVRRSWLLTALGGIAGNGVSVLCHPLAYRSVGFSTAIFATLGALAGVYMARQQEKLLPPLAATMALLALLGSEGPRTDYVAHLCGFASGIILGLFQGWAMSRHWLWPPQWLAAAVAWALPAGAWLWLRGH